MMKLGRDHNRPYRKPQVQECLLDFIEAQAQSAPPALKIVPDPDELPPVKEEVLVEGKGVRGGITLGDALDIGTSLRLVTPPASIEDFKEPEWLRQWRSVESGAATWEDYSFRERTCKGWLLPYLYIVDSMFSRRWMYWTEVLLTGVAGPIPQISFTEPRDKETLEMLGDCLDVRFSTGGDMGFTGFLEWVLWGFGDPDGRNDHVNDRTNEALYRKFNLGLLLKHPSDYLGYIKCENRGRWKDPLGFFPTPHHVCELMARMTYGDQDPEKMKCTSVCDPCVGTARLLLHASNFSLNLMGNDIDRGAVLASKVNGFLYVPWLVKPYPFHRNGATAGEVDSHKEVFA